MYKKLLMIWLLLFFVGLYSPFAFSKINITDYQSTFIPLFDQADSLNVAIRMYYVNGDLYFLCVDPSTLQTKILLAKQTTFRGNYKSVGIQNNFSKHLLEATPYMKLLYDFSKAPYVAENYGVIRAKNNVNGVYLTIDMCPSSKPFEKRLFLALESLADKLQRPLPIAVSISGLWLLQHQQEFIWLLKKQAANKLAITWINHSFSHPYDLDLPAKNNFLVSNSIYFEQEVLATEKLLLEYGQKPSIYFRFPGLVSNEELIKKLKTFGLVSIGSDAWLAKNQKPQNGSVILIHGNSNEPKGVDEFLSLLRNTYPNFLPLDQGILSVLTKGN